MTLSRFLPILRTIAPFVAGVGQMPLFRFTLFNALGGILWTVAFVMAGFLFGNLEWVKNNFTLMVLALIFIPLIPALVGIWKASRRKNLR